MVWIIVLGVILLVLGLVLFTPILVRVIREESLLVRLQIGPAKIQVYPPKEEASEEGLPEGEEKRKKNRKKSRRRNGNRSRQSRSFTCWNRRRRFWGELCGG